MRRSVPGVPVGVRVRVRIMERGVRDKPIPSVPVGVGWLVWAAVAVKAKPEVAELEDVARPSD